MQNTRKNVWELGGDWADPILWYARGVKAMKARTIDQTTSWDFYGAIHGFNQQLWKQYGYWNSTGAKPSSENIKRFWEQCQHGSWYFLPWHRGYLLEFEANIRAAAGAPSDWALPYWNYFKPHQNKLPPAFSQKTWPDGGDNPLFVAQRYGPDNSGNVYVPPDQVNLDALNDPEFTGVGSGGGTSFGGIDTGFEHAGNVHGGVETQPHDMVHVLVGGSDPNDPQLPGLMSDPDTAGLDPIFWLHHANIDRLWEVWRRNPPSHLDPSDSKWLKGPASIGEREFTMPKPDGKAWNYTPGDMTNLASLGYIYDDLAPVVAAEHRADRLSRLGASAATVSAVKGVEGVPSGQKVELVGASRGAIQITGTEAQTSVKLDQTVRRKVAASLTAVKTAGSTAPDKVFLNLENVRGLTASTRLRIFIGDQEVGTVGLFGLRKASQKDEKHAGNGLRVVLNITKIVDALHLENKLDVDGLDVRVVPLTRIPADAPVTIGRVSIYREGE